MNSEDSFTVLVGTGDTVEISTGEIRPVEMERAFAARALRRVSTYQPEGQAAVGFETGATYVAEDGVTSVRIRSEFGLLVTCTEAIDEVVEEEPETTEEKPTEETKVVQPSLAKPASKLGANSQTNATRRGVSGSTRGRLSGGGVSRNSITANSFFLSTQNLPGAASNFNSPDWSIWISGEGRSYSGSLSGWTADIVTGVDKLVTDSLIVGGLLGFGRLDISDATRNANATSVAVGAYFAKRFQSDLFLDGFVSAARPKYTVDGTAFTASRASATLTLSGSFTAGSVKITPSGTLAAYRESLPAYVGASGAVAADTIENLNLNLGAKLEPIGPLANGILPYIALSVDHSSNNSTVSGKTTFTSPRLGIGFSAAVGGGYLSVDIDAGNVQSGVRDVGLRASYEFNF